MDIIQFFSDSPFFFLTMVAFVSLFIGSFLNVVIYRLPKIMEKNWNEECRIYLGLKLQNEKEKFNLCLPFSHCPQCKKSIKPWHNIPVLSYLFLKGQCAFCHARISIRYPLVELLTCLMSVYIAWKFGFTWHTLSALLFTWCAISLTFIDLDCHLLPDQLTLSLLWLGLFFSLFTITTNSHDAIIGAILGYAIFAMTQMIFGSLTGKTGMGQGDFKFLAALGAYLGWQLLPLIILLASMTGIVCALILMFIKQHFKSEPLPFGPYLAIAGWVAMIWGNEILTYYLQLF